MRKIIEEKLTEIEEKEHVRIIMAVESGSRAWGFASPDSDYDVRFIYVRTLDDYLRLEETRDVIEWQLDEVLDINGWDAKKALILLHNCNPSVFEWLGSPVVYRTGPEFEYLKEIRAEYFSPKKSVYHYWHMAEGNYKRHLLQERVELKKIFYVIRPVLAAKWASEKQTPPPVSFHELLEGSDLTLEIKFAIDRLLLLKQDAGEGEMIDKDKTISQYIETSLEKLKHTADQMQDKAVRWDTLDAFFQKLAKPLSM